MGHTVWEEIPFYPFFCGIPFDPISTSTDRSTCYGTPLYEYKIENSMIIDIFYIDSVRRFKKNSLRQIQSDSCLFIYCVKYKMMLC